MIYEDYKKFYDIVIKEYIDEICSYDNDEFRCLSVHPKACKKIYKNYEQKRIEIRSKMSEESKPIDRHKTAACMMYAILKTRVFKINYSVPDLPYVIRLANEYLAFFVGLNMIEQYKRKDQQLQGKQEDYQLVIPETIYEVQKDIADDVTNSSFIISVCLTLANIKNINYFDTFSYATILFLMEVNTDNLLQYQNKGSTD